MPPPPPAYLIREQVDAICHSATFDPHDLLQQLLRFIVEQSLAGVELTEAILAFELWHDSSMGKNRVRMGVTRLRKKLLEYYKAIESQTAIIVISLPPAGLDAATREFKHYKATFSFHPGMIRSATTFAQILQYKYDVPLADGELWFNTGLEPVSLLHGAIQKHKAKALFVASLHMADADEERQALFRDIVSLYDLAAAVLEQLTGEDVVQRDIQVEITFPVVTQAIRSADTLSAHFVEVIAGRCAITRELQDANGAALRSIFIAEGHYCDLLYQKLLPAMGVRANLYEISYSPQDGPPIYVIMLIETEDDEAFKSAMAGSALFNLLDYGIVLSQGNGSPPAGLKETLREAYKALLRSDKKDEQAP